MTLHTSTRESETETSLDAERRAHEAFALSRRFAHSPRPFYLDHLDEHAAGDTPPLVLHAPSGAGKSALVAYWAHRYRREHPDAFVLEHYIGSASAGHADILRRLVLEIGERSALTGNLPETPEGLVREFSRRLALVAGREKEPVIIIIDALNQLLPDAHDPAWLPAVMPSSIRLVVTTADETMVESLRRRGWRTMKVKPLTAAERRDVVGRFLSERPTGLTTEHLRGMTADAGSANPLLLRTRLEEASAAEGDAAATIDYYLNARTLDDLYERVLRRLEDAAGAEPARNFLTTLWGSRSGLNREELAGLTSLSEPQMEELIGRLGFHLLERDGLFTFFHEYLRRAVEHRWLNAEDEQRTLHLRLADYFEKDPGSERNVREFVEQLFDAGERERLAEALADIERFMVLYEGESKYRVLTLWGALRDNYNPGELYRKSLDRYTHNMHTDPCRDVDAMKAVSILLRTVGKWDDAEEVCTQALSVAEEIGDRYLIATVRVLLGTMSWKRGNPERAEQCFVEALATMRDLGEEYRAATIIGNLGNLYYSRGNFEKALECHRENLRVVRESENFTEVARILGNMGSAYVRLERLDDGLACFTEMMSIAERTGNISAVAAATGNIGIVRHSQGKYQEAAKSFQRQALLAEQIGSRQILAAAVGNEGNALFEMKNYEEALLKYQQQKNIAKEIGDVRQEATAMGNMGMAYAKAGKAAMAQKFYAEARRSFHTLEDHYETERLDALIGEVYAEDPLSGDT